MDIKEEVWLEEKTGDSSVNRLEFLISTERKANLE
jgi:hypothetical protein